jgi:hypothetical protein
MAKLPGAVQGARIVGERFVRSQRQHNPEGRMPSWITSMSCATASSR